jgi:acyl-CoA thioester hydrolase
MTSAPITHRGCVYPKDCDHMGHLNVASYVNKFDQATWNFFADLGLTRDYLERQGIGLAAVQQNTSYQRELMPGDVLTVRTALVELAGKKIRFRHEMTNGVTGDIAAVMELLAVCIDANTRKSRQFPDEIAARESGELKGGAN